MSKQEKTDIKLAYQTAAEIAFIIAVGLSKAKNQTTKKFRAKQQQSLG
jgi:hypothetical protein